MAGITPQFHCGHLKKPNLLIIRIKTDVKGVEKMKTAIGEQLQLVEHIEFEVSNTESISKDLLLHTSKFFEKILFQF